MSKQKLQIPSVVSDAVNALERRRDAAERRARNAEEERKLQENASRAKQRRVGISWARKIFNWAEAFRKDPAGRRIVTVGEQPCLDGVFFFTDKLPGKPTRDLGIGTEGLWWMGFGCGARERYVDSPEELAEQVDAEILKAAWQSIESGAVWDVIRKRLKGGE